MAAVAPETAARSSEASLRKPGGLFVYVTVSVLVVWLIFATVWSVINAFSAPSGSFSFGFLGGALFSAAMLLPLAMLNVGIPAIIAVIVGGYVARAAHSLWVRAVVIALAAMTAFVVPIALTWRGNEWDTGLVPTYVAMTLGVGALLAAGAVLPWRGGFASRRYDAEPATVPA